MFGETPELEMMVTEIYCEKRKNMSSRAHAPSRDECRIAKIV